MIGAGAINGGKCCAPTPSSPTMARRRRRDGTIAATAALKTMARAAGTRRVTAGRRDAAGPSIGDGSSMASM